MYKRQVYAHYPWKLLLKSGTKGVATSNYGRNLMKEIMPVSYTHLDVYKRQVSPSEIIHNCDREIPEGDLWQETF